MRGFDVTMSPGSAPEVLAAITEATHVYAEMRGVQRAIFPGEPASLTPPQNNAEHIAHIALVAQTLWEGRRELGIVYPAGVTLEAIHTDIFGHDYSEIENGDKDVMTTNLAALDEKYAQDVVGLEKLEKRYQHMSWLAQAGLKHIDKQTPVARFVSDTERNADIVLIRHYAPNRWLGDGGAAVTRERHDQVVLSKMCIDFGRQLFREQQKELDMIPERFLRAAATKKFAA